MKIYVPVTIMVYEFYYQLAIQLVKEKFDWCDTDQSIDVILTKENKQTNKQKIVAMHCISFVFRTFFEKGFFFS